MALADEATCVALATNPSLSSDHIQALAATRLPAVLTALAYRDDLYEELIPFLIEHSPDFRRHWAIQQKPATLADPELTRRLLADPLPTIRALAVAAHPWRRADLYDFARDRSPAVRLAALQHAHASDELIAGLLADPSPEIAAAAAAQQAARAPAPRRRLRPKARQEICRHHRHRLRRRRRVRRRRNPGQVLICPSASISFRVFRVFRGHLPEVLRFPDFV